MIKQKISDVERLDEIFRTLVEKQSGYLIERIGLEDHLPFIERMKVKSHEEPGPERLRETFEELGTTFIKLGQMLANRPDVVPPEYVEELEKLEYAVEPFEWEKAEQVIDEEVGLDSFESIKEEPMAAASIAQVHEAVLESGEEVVIKVRRPDIKEQVKTDLEILNFLAKEADTHFSKARELKLKDIVDQFCDWTTDELDFNKEARNSEIFEQTLPDDEKARTPKVYSNYSTEAILTMEKIEGIKCTNTEEIKESDIDIEEVTDTILGVGLKQTIVEGFFHGDPHPSNFLIEEDGTVVYIDFGITGTISKKERNLMGLMVVHLINEDVDAAVKVLQDLAYVEDDADIERLKRIVTEKTLEIKNTTVAEKSVSMELLDIAVEASKLGVHMPNTVILVGKDLMTIEGIAMKVRPESQMDDQVKEKAMDALKEANQPEDLAETFTIDLLQNKDVITKLPSKINESLSSSQDIHIKNIDKKNS